MKREPLKLISLWFVSFFLHQAGRLVKLAAVKECVCFTVCIYTCCNYHESPQQRNFHICCATWFGIINSCCYWYLHEWQYFKQTYKATSAAGKSIIHFQVKLWQMSAIPSGLVQLPCLSHATLSETISKSHLCFPKSWGLLPMRSSCG